MFCYVTLPNNVVLKVEVDAKANGQECLDKVCEQLGIIEIDYFGLHHKGTKGEQLWLNMRNSISRQITDKPPHQLGFKVKFYVQPHLLLQETTRNQFYLSIKQEFMENNLRIPEGNFATSICGLIAQAELGDFEESHLKNYPSLFPDKSPEELRNISKSHLSNEGVSQGTAQYKMLQTVSEFDCYGVEIHHVLDNGGVPHLVGVGPRGIAIYQENWTLLKRIEYPTVQMATHSGKCLILHIFRDDGSIQAIGFKLVSHKAANALYRCVIEMHSFYRCDSVRYAVAAQYSRDLKGKRYVFDITRTGREAYDHFRRQLYSNERLLSHPDEACAGSKRQRRDSGNQPKKYCHKADCQDVQDRLERLEELLCCRICMDDEISTTFIPCGHLVCCKTCAKQVTVCPICRHDIEKIQKVFLPMKPTRTIVISRDGEKKSKKESKKETVATV